MENQDQRLNNPPPLPKPTSDLPHSQSPHTLVPSNPKLTAEQAQDLLAINGLGTQTVKPESSKHSKKFLIIIAAVIVLVIVAATFASLGNNTKKTSDVSNSTVPNAKNDPLTGGSVTQQAQYCSNVLNANTAC